MGGMIGKAMVGAGQALATVGVEGFRAQLQEARDARLNEYQGARDDKLMAHQSREAQLGRDTTVSEGQKGRDAAKDLHAMTDTRIQSEGKATRDLQRELAASQESAANSRHRDTIGVQLAQLNSLNDQVALQPQADGKILMVKKDGTSKGFLQGPDGNDIIGPKNVSDSARLLIEGNNRIQAALAKDFAEATDPAVKKDLSDRMAQLQADNKRMAGMTDSAGAAAPATGSKWDDKSGQVTVNGVVIGSASNETDARKLVDNHKKGAGKKPAAAAAPRAMIAPLMTPPGAPAEDTEEGALGAASDAAQSGAYTGRATRKIVPPIVNDPNAY